MSSLERDLLEYLKRRFEECGGSGAYQDDRIEGLPSARAFYLKNLEDNLVRPMDDGHFKQFEDGDGGELEGKMLALRSSSAMTFNLLGNARCEIRGLREDLDAAYSIRYEDNKLHETLKHGRRANLDAVLLSEGGDTLVACEMKLLEWLTGSPKPLREAYLDVSSYRFEDTASAFAEAARVFSNPAMINRFDSPQMFRHLLALYNALRRGKWPRVRKLVLLACVWEPNPADFKGDARRALDAAIQEERREFEFFQKRCRPLIELFEKEGVCAELLYRNAADVAQAVSHPARERALLGRYGSKNERQPLVENIAPPGCGEEEYFAFRRSGRADVVRAGYTRKKIERKCRDALKTPLTFYRQPFLNYRGRCVDSGELYTEVVAGFLLDNIEVFQGIESIERARVYDISTHTGESDSASSRREENIAKALFDVCRGGRVFDGIGRVIDYQTPLGGPKKEPVGNLDLLACDGNCIRILELKTERSRETMLRCAMEAFTYLKVVDRNVLNAIVSGCGFEGSEDMPVVASPLVFEGGAQHNEMLEDRPRLKQLLKRLGVEPLYIAVEGDAFGMTSSEIAQAAVMHA